VWTLAFLVFGSAYAACSPWAGVRVRRPVALIGVQTVASLTMVAATGDTLVAATLVVVAGQLIGRVSSGRAAVWVALQTTALVGLYARTLTPGLALTIGAAFGGFEMFALATGALALRERRAREALARSHAELQATRALLVEHSRAAERLSISRDLHDALGHHLTALSLQLDVASRLADGKAADHVGRAHAITRLLLSDVRDVVSRLREGGRIDLAQAVRSLADAQGPPVIHLDLPAELTVDDDGRAQAILRCVQEVITNASRHAEAENLWIRIEVRPGGIAVDARDDGRGAVAIACGHGLTGMRERFEQCAGRIEFRAAAGQGFEVHGFIPQDVPAS
jgi:signal transduction histidine kinase